MHEKTEEIRHWGFHFGFDVRFTVPAELVPDYPDKGAWFQLKDRFGEFLNVDEKAAFVQGYQEGTKAEECPSCKEGILGHKKFLNTIYR